MGSSWCPQTWYSAWCSSTTTLASLGPASPTRHIRPIPPVKRAPPSTLSQPPTAPTATKAGTHETNKKKTWFTDEPENTHLRTIQIKPVNTLAVNQVSQYKSTSSLIPPIREAEDEFWAPDLCRHQSASAPRRLLVQVSDWDSASLLTCKHKSSIGLRRDEPFCFPLSPLQQAYCTRRFRIIHEDNHSQMWQPLRCLFAQLIFSRDQTPLFFLFNFGEWGSLEEEQRFKND